MPVVLQMALPLPLHTVLGTADKHNGKKRGGETSSAMKECYVWKINWAVDIQRCFGRAGIDFFMKL